MIDDVCLKSFVKTNVTTTIDILLSLMSSCKVLSKSSHCTSMSHCAFIPYIKVARCNTSAESETCLSDKLDCHLRPYLAAISEQNQLLVLLEQWWQQFQGDATAAAIRFCCVMLQRSSVVSNVVFMSPEAPRKMILANFFLYLIN